MKPTSFNALSLPAAMLENLETLGYAHMTPVQAASLPPLLDRKDAIVRARTGSGKTLAFGIDLIVRLKTDDSSVQGLVLCPTRELADQVAGELRRISRYLSNIKIVTLGGGVPLGPQRDTLAHGAHVVVGTPGRILDHLGKQTLSLSNVHTFILDEADRMLDMGFAADIGAIAAHLPQTRQTLLFSATYPDTIASLSAALLKAPVTIHSEAESETPDLSQHFFRVKGEKTETLTRLLGHFAPESAVLFCNTKQQCDALADTLRAQGYDIGVLHGGFTQDERSEMLTRFAVGGIRLLIATDVAARGLDIKQVGAVFNYDLPEKPETYLHRIGRTARAGSSGTALSLFTPKQQPAAERLAHAAGTDFHAEDASLFAPAAPEAMQAAYGVLRIDGGRKNKLRPGDLLGALCASGGIEGSQVGGIVIGETVSYAAIAHAFANDALHILQRGKIKGKKFRVRIAE